MKKIILLCILLLITPLCFAGEVEERRYIHHGMTEGEVLYKAGQPDHIEEEQNKYGAVITKRFIYYPAKGDEQTMYTVTITNGKVRSVDKKVMR